MKKNEKLFCIISLLTLRSCGAEIMDEAIICPKCGYETSRNTNISEKEKSKNEFGKKELFDLLLMICFLISGMLLVVSTAITIWVSICASFILNLLNLIFVIPAIVFSILSFVYRDKTTLDKYKLTSFLCISIFFSIQLLMWIAMVLTVI